MKSPLTAATPVRLALLAALGVAATAANAQSMVTARVLGAQPVVEQVPVQECGPNRASGTGAAVGAVTGGLIGSQIGRGNGHIAGAILGALGGAVLGNTAEAYNNGYGGCATRYSQRVTGYDVTYEYQGRQYQTRTAQAPGQWLQVPAPYGYEGQQQDYGYNNGGYNSGSYNSGVQTYPVQPAPVSAYPVAPAYSGYPAVSAPVVTAPPAVAYPYPAQPVVQAPYPVAYPQPYVYPAPVYQAYPAPVYVQPAPRYVAPVGVSLSVGGRIGRHSGAGIGVGF
ncbi:glycine zipper 2TM domain-containing protein [Ottowia oryzae]|uniref:Glycine zipper 2TM domain-containing protein n=1 Tax=Ottowia oryzae TaxID=2109914 RepID=A0A2S0MCL1_9BURK|nr:glycine zipper 2TM domain-containing protein [Ottowia oryzae]AVO33511.1 hypothetical protein C6570_04025 [Ottowia oryzae]